MKSLSEDGSQPSKNLTHPSPVLRIKTKTLHIFGKGSTIELHTLLSFIFLFFILRQELIEFSWLAFSSLVQLCSEVMTLLSQLENA